MTPWEQAKADSREVMRKAVQDAIDASPNRKIAAYTLGVSYSTFQDACLRYRADMSKFKDERRGGKTGKVGETRKVVISMRKQGRSVSEIADQTGTTKENIINHIRRAKL